MGRRPVRVLVADDHPVFRDGLAMLLGSIEGVEVVGTAASGEQAISLVAERHPDVVIMDVQMPGLNGMGDQALGHRHPDRGAGADDVRRRRYCSPGTGRKARLSRQGAEQDEIVRAIAAVAEALPRRCLFADRGALRRRPPRRTPSAHRCEQILDLVAAGRSNAQIAAARLPVAEDGTQQRFNVR
jgi:DNA-binding NarL/FixJ family response regulator